MAAATATPSHAQILVIGGGPAGCFAASALSREGFDVVLLESAKFPRYHVGESMIPSIRPFLRFIDADEKIAKHGFTIKPGAAFKFNQFKREGYANFTSESNTPWNVVRSQFDEILLRHAAECGAKVFEERKVTHIEISDSGRPTHVTYQSPDGASCEIAIDYLVDASGRNGLMSTKYLKNRRMNSSLKNIACWGYWTGAKAYMPGTDRQNAPWFEALTDESGWGWFIPLHNGTVSVGIVMDLSVSSRKKTKAREALPKHDYSLRQHYLDQLDFVPGIKTLLGDAVMRDDGITPVVQSASDFSYSAMAYAGDHYRLIGDAAAFIDPFFSSGVHLAFTGGLSAAISIAASIRAHCPENDAIKYHNVKVGVAYTRFLLVVTGAYKQIRAQNLPVLSDIDEDNFDRAFELLRPIIRGASEVDKQVTNEELQKTMNFVSHALVSPLGPETLKSVTERLPKELVSPDSKVLLEDEIKKMIAPEDEDALFILREINAWKPVRGMFNGPARFGEEGVDGMFGIAKRGALGIAFFVPQSEN